MLRGYFFRQTCRSIASRNDDAKLLSFGRHLTFTMIPGQIRQHYDKLIIAVFLSLPELAIYAIALGFSELLLSISPMIAALIYPKLSKMTEETAYSEVKKRWPLLILGIGVIGGIIILLCPYVIPIFYSQNYAGSILYAQLLLISVVIAAPAQIINKALLPSQKRIKDLYKLRVFGSVIEIVLLTILALKFGLLGAVIAIIAGRTVTTFYSLKLAGFLSFR